MQSERQWLDHARAAVLQGDWAKAESLSATALVEHPHSFELRRLLAGVYQQTARDELAEPLFRELLRERPQDFACAFTWARLQLSRARGHAAAQVLRKCFEQGERDAELGIKAVELLDEADRKEDAAAIAEIVLAHAPADARLHAYAGMLQLQLGRFEQGRAHYLHALNLTPEACEWHAPLGLAHAQRYMDAGHPDFALFNACLKHGNLSEKARSTLLFALGKAHDDVGDPAQAAAFFRDANALARNFTRWSPKTWRRGVEAALATPPGARLEPLEEFIPVFIVGMPRSGTTLLAELLGRFPQVRNRGELPWIATVAQRTDLAGNPERAALGGAAAIYRSRVMQDDSDDARWFIDKQPLNFRYVDLMLALFPNARIIWCRRSPRDTALSLWTQSFNEDVQGYAYDFGNIAKVMHDCDRLMSRWLGLHPDSIRMVHYESLIADTRTTLEELARWLDLPPQSAEPQTSSIGTSSLWQARQPIYSRSVGRWRAYREYIPELLAFAETAPRGRCGDDP